MLEAMETHCLETLHQSVWICQSVSTSLRDNVRDLFGVIVLLLGQPRPVCRERGEHEACADCLLDDLLKTGGRLIRHARYFTLQLAESYLTGALFRQILRRIERLAWHPT